MFTLRRVDRNECFILPSAIRLIRICRRAKFAGLGVVNCKHDGIEKGFRPSSTAHGKLGSACKFHAITAAHKHLHQIQLAI